MTTDIITKGTREQLEQLCRHQYPKLNPQHYATAILRNRGR